MWLAGSFCQLTKSNKLFLQRVFLVVVFKIESCGNIYLFLYERQYFYQVFNNGKLLNCFPTVLLQKFQIILIIFTTMKGAVFAYKEFFTLAKISMNYQVYLTLQQSVFLDKIFLLLMCITLSIFFLSFSTNVYFAKMSHQLVDTNQWLPDFFQQNHNVYLQCTIHFNGFLGEASDVSYRSGFITD